MGYHVSIIRTVEGRGIPIRPEELRALARSHEGLRLDEDPGGAVRLGLADGGEAGPELVLQGGELWTKTPDRPTLAWMIELATELGARVRGDELETYRSPDETYLHPDDRREREGAQLEGLRLARRVRIRGWILRLAVIGTAVLAGVALESFVR